MRMQDEVLKINKKEFFYALESWENILSRMEQLINPTGIKELEISQALSSCTQPSGLKWGVTNVGYTVGADIPFSWISKLAGGASAWNQAGSRFRFSAGNNSFIGLSSI